LRGGDVIDCAAQTSGLASLPTATTSVFDFSTFAPAPEDIERNTKRMAPAAALKISGGVRLKSPRGIRRAPSVEDKTPATLPNTSLEEPSSFDSETSIDEAVRMERVARLGQRLRTEDLLRLQPSKSKRSFQRGTKPTRQGGGRVYQPGGAMRGN